MSPASHFPTVARVASPARRRRSVMPLMCADVRSRQRQGRLSSSTEIKTRHNRPEMDADAFLLLGLYPIAQMPQILPTRTPEAERVTKAVWKAVDGADVGSTIAALTMVLVGIFMDIEQPDRDDASGCFAMTFYDVTTRHPKFQQEMMLAEWDPKVRAN
jgi:hypothetical protein